MEERLEGGGPPPSDEADQPPATVEQIPYDIPLRALYDRIADHSKARSDDLLKVFYALFEQRLFESQGRERFKTPSLTPEEWVLAIATELSIKLQFIKPDKLPASLSACAFHTEVPYLQKSAPDEFTVDELWALRNLGYQGGPLFLTSVTSGGENTRVYLLFTKDAGEPNDKRGLESIPLQTLSRMYGEHRRRWIQHKETHDSLWSTRSGLAATVGHQRKHILSLEAAVEKHQAARAKALLDASAIAETVGQLEQKLTALRALAAKQFHKGSNAKRQRPGKLERDIAAAEKTLEPLKSALQELQALIDPKPRGVRGRIFAAGIVG